MSMKHKLRKPIQAHGEEIEQLDMREPTGADIRELGLPYRINPEDSTIIVDARVVAKYISSLGAIPSSSVDQLSGSDFSALSMAVVGFFGNAE